MLGSRRIAQTKRAIAQVVVVVAASLCACSLTVDKEGAIFGEDPSGSGGHSENEGGTAGEDSTGGKGGKPSSVARGGANQSSSSTGGASGVGGSSAGGAPGNGGSSAAGASGVGGSSAAGGSGTTTVALPPAVLKLYYPFDTAPTDGITVGDASGNNLSATLKTNISGETLSTFSNAGHKGNAITFNSAKQHYVELPKGFLASSSAASFSCWLKLSAATNWDRLFDIGSTSSSTYWMYFSPTGWNTVTATSGTHFAISTPVNGLEPEMMLKEIVLVGAWHHVVVVLAPPSFYYYLDGVEKYRSNSMNTKPSDLGVTDRNWIGRSVFPADPFLSADLDEFKVFDGALTPSEIATLYAQ